MKKSNLYSMLALSAAILVLSSCGSKISKPYEVNDVTLIAEGPLFEGSNTLQATTELDLSKAADWAKADNVHGCKISKIVLSTEDSLGFDMLNNIIVQVVSEKAGMVQIGVLNPIEKGQKQITLNVAKDADLKHIFEQKDMTIVADADLIGDRDANLEIKAQLLFDLELKD